jgi:predicted lipoprotein
MSLQDTIYADARAVRTLEQLRWFVANVVAGEHDAVHAVAACAVAAAMTAESEQVQWEFIRGWGKTRQWQATPPEQPTHADEIQPCCGLPWSACGHKLNDFDRAYNT